MDNKVKRVRCNGLEFSYVIEIITLCFYNYKDGKRYSMQIVTKRQQGGYISIRPKIEFLSQIRISHKR